MVTDVYSPTFPALSKGVGRGGVGSAVRVAFALDLMVSRSSCEGSLESHAPPQGQQRGKYHDNQSLHHAWHYTEMRGPDRVPDTGD